MKRLGGGELESRVMDVIWDGPEWMTPGEVHEVITESRPVSYTTVLTVIVRLWQKERLERERDGKPFAYRALMTREEYTASRMQQLLVTASDSSSALGHFVDQLPASQRDQLRRLLKLKK